MRLGCGPCGYPAPGPGAIPGRRLRLTASMPSAAQVLGRTRGGPTWTARFTTSTLAGRQPGRSPRHIKGAAGDRAVGVALSGPSPALSRSWRLALRIAGAGLLAATAAIHLDLYLTGYRTIPVIGWLFLLQVIAGFGLAVAVLASGRGIVAAAGAGFAAAGRRFTAADRPCPPGQLRTLPGPLPSRRDLPLTLHPR